MNENVIADIIHRHLEHVINARIIKEKLYCFLLLGPPSIGKTFLQKSIFRKWIKWNPTFLQVSAFILERKVRFQKNISECEEKAYRLPDMRQSLCELVAGNNTKVRVYDHKNGEYFIDKILLNSSKLLYLEGPMWLRCLDIIFPDFIVILKPKSIETWRFAYLHRNTVFRNYSIDEAKIAFELALTEWFKSLEYLPTKADLTILVDFEPQTFQPVFHIHKWTKKNG